MIEVHKIKKGDDVIVLSGKEKGKSGRVSKVENGKVTIDGINQVKKSKKSNSNESDGGFYTIEKGLNISKVALYNSERKKKDRVGFKILENGEKVRIYKSTGRVVDN